MTSLNKQRANRENSLRSTGPRTETGKARSSKNAQRHGILSRQPLLADEDAREFEHFRAEIFVALGPEGAMETLFAERAAFASWRLRRLVKVEVATLESTRYRWNTREDQGLGVAFIGLCNNGDVFSKLSRYEAALERGLYKALHELERSKAMRAGRDVPLPVPIDLNISGHSSAGELGSFSRTDPEPTVTPDASRPVSN